MVGRGLARFDWPVTKIGIAFARRGTTVAVGGATNTALPPEGVDILVFQVRWLDQAAEEPVVAAISLHAESVGADAPVRWEDHQTRVLNHFEPDRTGDGTQPRTIKSGTVSNRGIAIAYSGAYLEVRVAQLLSQDKVMTELVKRPSTFRGDPAMAESSSRYWVYEDAGGLAASAMTITVVAALLGLAGLSILEGAFPVIVVLGPLMVLQYALWAHRRGQERTTWQYLQAEPLLRPGHDGG